MAYKPDPVLMKLSDDELREQAEIYEDGLRALQAQINGQELTAEQKAAIEKLLAVHASFPKPSETCPQSVAVRVHRLDILVPRSVARHCVHLSPLGIEKAEHSFRLPAATKLPRSLREARDPSDPATGITAKSYRALSIPDDDSALTLPIKR